MIDSTKELMNQAGINGTRASVVGVSEDVAINTAVMSESSGQLPDPEVREVKRRLYRKLEDRHRIVKEFDACVNAGDKGAVLRREGIYASYIHRWRREIDQRALLGLSSQKRGPKEDPAKKEKLRIATLEKQVLHLEKDLKKCHIIIDVQKKISEILGIAQEPVTEDPRS